VKHKAGLPTVEQMLTAAAKRRAERSRARRRGTGFAVIAFAGLALAGSAAAATGLWDPLPFGGGQPEVSKPAAEDGSGTPTEVAPPVAPGPTPKTSPSLRAEQKRGRTQGASGRTTAPSTDLPAANPLPPPPSQGSPSGADAPSREPRGGGAAQGASDGGSRSTPSGGGGGGGGSGGQPNTPGPNEENGNPGPAQISVACSAESVTVGQTVSCKATVRSSGPTPTGEVLFKSTGPGAFSMNPCTLGNGGGGVSSCGVTYTPESTGSHQITAIYGGDGANASNSTSFVIKSNP
jgi:hypothetical protein